MNEDQTKRPEFVKDKHLEYLDELRDSGVTNMLGGGNYLQTTFGLDKKMASDIFWYWADTFGQENR